MYNLWSLRNDSTADFAGVWQMSKLCEIDSEMCVSCILMRKVTDPCQVPVVLVRQQYKDTMRPTKR